MNVVETKEKSRMRSLWTVGLGMVIGMLGLSPRAAVAQTVAAEAAIAAELEISTADPRIGILFADNWTYDYRDPEADSADVDIELESWAGSAGLIRRLWAHTRVRGELTTGRFHGISRSTPQFELVNGTDATIRLEGFVHIPDVLHPTSPGAYFYEAFTEEGISQIALVELRVNLLTGSLEGAGDSIFFTNPQTRPSLDPEPGPRQIDAFGVPFATPIILDVPPSFREIVTDDEVILEITPFGVRLAVHAEVTGLAPFGSSTSESLVVDSALMCRETSFPPLALPPAPLARLCRANRLSAAPISIADAPICSCLRDDALRAQRCTFQFADLDGRAELTAPLKPGEIGVAEWTFHPVGKAGGVYDMTAALFVDGKWVPVGKLGHAQPKRRSRGKYVAGRPIRERVRFRAPETPTVLRTLLRLWPEGAKTPIESATDVFVALRKPRPVEQ